MLQRKVFHRSRPLQVLVETDDAALQLCDFNSFAAAGFDVAVCAGPGDGHDCPAVEGQACDLVDQADVVLNVMQDPTIQRLVVEAVHAGNPEVPMVVSVAPGFQGDLPEGCVPLSGTVTVAGQTRALRRSAVRAR